MAATTKTWADNSAPTLNAADLNGIKNENNNLIVGAGLALSTSDNQQTHKAVAIYASAGDFYTETGAADAYVCTVVGARLAPPSYLNGMRVRFIAGNTNTGASTVNVDGLGVKGLIDDQTGLALPAGAISTTSITTAYYDGTNFRLIAPLTVDNLLASTLTHDMASDADYTLLATESRFGRILITDTTVNLTVARNIVVADTERSFYVQNDTLQTLTFKTAAGTGIAVLKGNRAELLCDGTDVINIGNSSLIRDVTVSGGAVTQIDFTGLDINTHKGYRIEIDAVNATASAPDIAMYVNNDTTSTNYYNQALSAVGAVVTGAQANAATIGSIAANAETKITMRLSMAGSYPIGLASGVSGPAASVAIDSFRGYEKTATVTNITQLTFVASIASALANGTRIRIYREDT